MPKINQNAYEGRDATIHEKGVVQLATAAEAAAGTNNTKALTPSTGSSSVPAASETVAGKAELATQAETNTGTDDTRIVTPLKLKTNLTTPPAIGGTTPNSGAFTTVSATTTITAGTGITATTGNISATAGAVSAGTTVTAGTSITATLGNITATNGNMVRGTAGNKDVYTSVATTTAAGDNSAGTVTLVGGTATISTTAVTANSLIRIYRQGVGATGAAALGLLSIGTITASTSFVINSVQAADATALQASDVSVIFWEIVN